MAHLITDTDCKIKVEGRAFFKGEPVCFYGHPGSARASAMAGMLGKLAEAGIAGYSLICADTWTVGKGDQLRLFAESMGITYRQFSSAEDYETVDSYSSLYMGGADPAVDSQHNHFACRKVLVVDCSRHALATSKYFANAGLEKCDGLVLTRLDSTAEVNVVLAYFAGFRIPLLFAVWGNSTANDCGFAQEGIPSPYRERLGRWWAV